MTYDDDGYPVDKPLTQAVLETGAVRLTPAEAESLGLGVLSSDVAVVRGADEFIATWNARSHRLSGEAFRDVLQQTGTAGGRIRLRATGGAIELALGGPVLLPPPARVRPLRPAPVVTDERRRVRDRSEYQWTGSVGTHVRSRERLEDAVAEGGWDSPEMIALRIQGELLAAVNGFDDLMAIDLASIDHMAHQEAAAATALGVMRGRAILADEAGLGKTIEAGLVMKELLLRGLVRRVLVLCPATLRDHWQAELREKFSEKFTVVTSADDPAFAEDRLIVSLSLATQQREQLLSTPWDLVIVDEAHRLAGANAVASRALIESLQSRYLLLLTATPVRNNLVELYHLTELVRPGTFRSEREFRNRFVAAGSDHLPSDAVALQQIVAEVMICTTREHAGLDRIARATVAIPVEPSLREREAYSICTDLLRRVLNRPEDSFRRRQLADRLTSSPQSLASTALRMADTVGVPEAEGMLRAVGDLLIDFGLTSRQRKLIELLNEWTTDTDTKGRVIVFAQHYETLHDLARILTEQGIDVAIYHGGLTAAARQRAIEQFRGTAPVLLTTDAGAEGLDLQFANCVVNYDLPWNPMRIEQRIGRVHRMTQPRDTVHVANLYARDTVDEQIYEIMHDKLRLFDLLFGQVTAVLGELDNDMEQSFETQVLDALFSTDDREMSRRLQQLGRQIDHAIRTRIDEASASGRQLNAWFVDQSTSRAESALRTRHRRVEVRDFALGVLRAIGADVYFTSSDNDFISARLPEGFAESIGGRQELHLAFSPQGLDHQRDAELCVVGSPVFEEFVATLQQRGDLVGLVPEFPAAANEPAFAHAPDVHMVGRTILGPQQWGAQVTWRLRDSGAVAGDAIVVTTVGDIAEYRTASHRAIHADEPLPRTARSAASIVRWATTASLPALQQRQAQIEGELVAAAARERDRQLPAWAARADEARDLGDRDSEARLRRAVDDLARQAPPTAELRADPLSIELVGSPSLDVVERWASATGVEVEVAYTWAAGTSPVVMGADGRAVEVLDICADAHLVDRAVVVACASCASKRCASCVDPIEACLACNRSMCRHCVTDLRVCRDCFTPKREQFFDGDGRVAWRLGSGSLLLVGTMSARIDNGPLLVDPTAEPDGMRRLRSYSREVGLPEDIGLRVEQLVPAPLPASVLGPRIDDAYEWRVDPTAGSAVDPRGFSLLPECPPDDVRSLEDVGLLALVTRLRALEAPGGGAQLVAVPVRTTKWIEFVGDELCVVTRVERAGDAVAESRARCRFAPPTVGGRADLACVAVGSVESIEMVRLNGSFILNWRNVGSWFVPGRAGVSEGTERALAEVARQSGMAAGAAVGITRGGAWSRELPSPAAAALVEAQQSESWVTVPSTDAEWLLDTDLASIGVIPAEALYPEAPAPMANALRASVARAGLDTAPVAAYRLAVQVSATWVGRSFASRTYRVFAGDPMGPVLDDSGARATDFEIDDLGHLHGPGRTWACRSCGRYRCGGCGDAGAIDNCATCGQSACGDCRAQARIYVPTQTCERCSARSCGQCRRTVELASCGVCQRSICGDCRQDRMCLECASPLRVRESDDDGLVAWRVGGGALVRVGESFVAIGDRYFITTPPEQVAPLTPRLWAHAIAAGRRIDAGLYAEGEVPVPAIDNVMCLSTNVGNTWQFDENRSGQIDVRALELLPDTSPGDAVASADPNLCEWANERRIAERPGVPPRLVATPVRTTSWIEVADSGLRYATRADAVGRARVEEREAIDVRAVDGSARPAVVGEALVAGRRLEIRRVNRSLEIEFEGTGTWFLAGDPSVDEAIERALVAASARLGIARGAAVGIVRSSGDAVDLPSPDAAPLLHMHVERSWPPVPVADADWIAGDDFDALGIERATATLPVVPEAIAAPVWQSLTSAVRAPVLFGLRQQLAVTATWAGRTSATRVVTGLAGEPIVPLLDDTGAPATDFEIDDLGHLHVPGQSWSCRSCDRHRCRGCGDAGAIDDCVTCGQPACGDCRAQEFVEIAVEVCARCSARSCGQCRRTIDLAACGLCERSICADCRPAGLCIECAAPSRASDHDVDGLIAWRIGNDTIALIGESFVSIGSRSLVTTAPATPLLSRLWAFAKNGGRRLDVGLRAEDPPPAVVVDEVIGLSTRFDYVWRFAEGGGGEVDVSLLQFFPDFAPDEPVVPADDATAAWAAARRGTEAPAPPPQVVAIPVRTTSWLEVADSTLVLATRVDALDGKRTESRDHVELQPVDDSFAPDVVGEASVDGRRLEVRRLNRSFIIELEGVGSWFLAGDANVDETIERAVANVTDRVAGDRDCSVGIVRPLDGDDVVPSPAAAPLQSADIKRSWLAVPVLRADWITHRDFAALGIVAAEAEHQVVPSAMADALLRVVVDSVRTPRLFGLRQRLDVTATWHGRVPVTRVVRVLSGDDIEPDLDDTGEPSADFEIDDLGHLHAAGQGWVCPSCARHRCGGCAESGALAPCPTCEQPACGDCRAKTPSFGDAAICARCDAESCGHCGRDIRAAECIGCRRTICRNCMTADVCQTCASLEPVDPRQAEQLPATLAAVGLEIRVGTDAGNTVIALVGRNRREVVVLDGDEVVSWRTVMPLDDFERRVRFAWSTMVRNGDLDIDFRQEPGGAALEHSFVVAASRNATLDARIEDEQGEVLWRPGKPPAAEVGSREDAIALASRGMVWPYDLMPQHVTEPSEAAAVQAMTSGSAATKPVRLVLEATEAVHAIVLGASGLQRLHGDVARPLVTEAPWEPVNIDPAVLSIPAPQGHLRSDLGDYAADLIGWGPYRFLVVGGPGGQVTTLALQHAAGFPDRVVAAAAVGIGGAVRIDSWCPLDQLKYVNVRKAQLKRRDAELVVQPHDGSSVLEDDSTAIATVAARVATQFTGLRSYAAAQPLDAAIAAELRAVLDSTCDGELRHVTLAVRVHDSWSADTGAIELSYDLNAASPVGLIEATDTRQLANVVTVDRAGHLAESVTECAYCATATCGQCVDGVSGCRLCSIAICSRCLGRETLCFACRDLRPTGHARRRAKSEPDHLHGEDDVHQVDVMPDGDGVARVVTASGDERFQFRVPLDPGLAQRLNAILQRDVFTGGMGS